MCGLIISPVVGGGVCLDLLGFGPDYGEDMSNINFYCIGASGNISDIFRANMKVECVRRRW